MFKLISEHMLELISLTDPEGIFQYVSPSHQALLGYIPENMIGTSYFSYLHPDDVDRIKKIFRHEYTNLKSNVATEFRYQHFRGHYIWIEAEGNVYVDDTGLPAGVIFSGRDITERKRYLEALRESEEKFRKLAETAPVAIFIYQDDRFVWVNHLMCRITGYDRQALLRLNLWDIIHPDHREFVRNRGRVLFKTSGTSSRFEFKFATKSGEMRWCDFAAAQIEYGGEPAVIASAYDITDRKLSDEELIRTSDNLHHAVGGTIQAMALAVEIRDPYTSGHETRVTDLATAIAREMDLPVKQVEAVNMAAMIHDVGKLYIPAEILSKPGNLNPMEVRLIHTHAKAGYDILKDITFPWPLADIVYQHHERLDGSGYPQKIKGDEILKEACIIAVADVVEAMSSHRPYRPTLGVDNALEEIDRNRHTLYDNEIVEACINLFQKLGYKMPENTISMETTL
ncbi:MAG: PAS domain S-box protein [Syntrophales bacterium]